jgi:hypothetical protein
MAWDARPLSDIKTRPAHWLSQPPVCATKPITQALLPTQTSVNALYTYCVAAKIPMCVTIMSVTMAITPTHPRYSSRGPSPHSHTLTALRQAAKHAVPPCRCGVGFKVAEEQIQAQPCGNACCWSGVQGTDRYATRPLQQVLFS